MGRKWHEWQAANRWYLTREILHLMLLSSGFGKVWFDAERRTCSLDVLADRLMQRDEMSFWQGVMAAHKLFPEMMRGWKLAVGDDRGGGSRYGSVATAPRPDLTVSIIVSVYNEGTTVWELLDSLLALRLAGVNKQVIIVESNSTDGSRQIVESYAQREMRKFTDAPFMAVILNLGHQFFRTLVNVALNTQMTDPFTMYKVFRRDALFGIDLRSNRFDLDIELVMKLVRKGYLPLDIPATTRRDRSPKARR